MRTKRIASVLLFLLAILPFAACWRFPYANIDDPNYFIMPEIIRSGLTFDGIIWAFSDISNGIWMPLVYLVYQADYTLREILLAIVPQLDGFQVAYSIAHIQSVILHGINAILLFAFLCRLAPKKTALAFGGAVIWAIHPLRVESVVWIASFKDVLSMSFFLGALSAWLDWRQTSRRTLFIRSHILFALACCAKPSVMTFPAVVFLLDALILGKVRLTHFNRKTFMVYVPSLVIAIPVAILAQTAQISGGATKFSAMVPFFYRTLNAVVSLGVYVRNLAWPSQLAVQCQLQWPQMPHFLVAGAILGSILVLSTLLTAIRLYKALRMDSLKDKLAEVGLLWGVGTILPMLGLSAFGGHAFADRFTYIPLVGVSIAILAIPNNFRRLGLAILSCAALCFAAFTIRQTSFWKDDLSLVMRTFEVDGDNNVIAHLNAGRYLFEHRQNLDDIRKAVHHFTRAFELNPGLSYSSTVIYMMALGECGETDDYPQIQMNFIRWMRDVRHVWHPLDQDVVEGLCDLYHPIGDPECARKRVRDFAYKLLEMPDRAVFQIDYFIYLTGKMTRDAELSSVGLERLKSHANRLTGVDQAVRFRFVYEKDSAS